MFRKNKKKLKDIIFQVYLIRSNLLVVITTIKSSHCITSSISSWVVQPEATADLPQDVVIGTNTKSHACDTPTKDKINNAIKTTDFLITIFVFS